MNESGARKDKLRGGLLGPEFSPDFVNGWLSQRGIPFIQYATEQELLEVVSAALVDGAVVGWFQGRMEFGPRALGARSILADPRNPAMQSRLNLRIKFRESFRPFAPSCLAERASAWFALDDESPYMLLTASVRAEHRIPLSAEQAQMIRDEPDLRRRVNIPRSTIPAVTDVDYSARVQTVTEERNGIFYRLIREFERRTGCPMLVNTSFNIRGEPIVCSPSDAYRCFRNTQMDMLVLENCVLVKSGQTKFPAAARESYQSSFLSD